ncbi:hypothetical protein V8C44DRAFT_337779 [Trichoderma aethiopicum]
MARASYQPRAGKGIKDVSGQAAWWVIAANTSRLSTTGPLLHQQLHERQHPQPLLRDCYEWLPPSHWGSSNVADTDTTPYAVSNSSNIAQSTDGWYIGKSTFIPQSSITMTA